MGGDVAVVVGVDVSVVSVSVVVAVEEPVAVAVDVSVVAVSVVVAVDVGVRVAVVLGVVMSQRAREEANPPARRGAQGIAMGPPAPPAVPVKNAAVRGSLLIPQDRGVLNRLP